MVQDSFMHRCLQLARLGAGYVAPNPMVGAVLVHDGKIIGEGYHRRYGEAHAEVNCIASVKEEDKALIPQSTLYVSLEPCAHFGKTPPCADLIIARNIPKVVIGCRDPFAQVSGKGIEKLQAAGVEVAVNVLEKECKELNKRFLTFHTLHRPYIILKWAQTANGKISAGNNGRLLVSNEYSNRIVHRWRSEEAAILVGTNTALADDPELTTRLWQGPSPIRLVVDMNLRLPSSLQLFNRKVHTVIFNTIRHEEDGNLQYYQLTSDVGLVQQLVHALYQLQVQSVLVEGGAKLLQSFIDEGMWDEVRRISSKRRAPGGYEKESGLAAPEFTGAVKVRELKLLDDTIEIFHPHPTNLLSID